MALIMLGLFLGTGEAVLRQEAVQAYLTTPTLNTRHRHFERQWYRLEALTKSGIQPDCIALGNSMLLNSFDPQIFGRVFYKQTGRELRCFNFGVDALTPVSANALAQILIETYQPKLLIFGTDARDFAIDRDSEETSVITDTAWIQYRLGHFSLEGWLVDHSYLYRYRRSLADLMHLSINRAQIPVTNQYGFEPYDIIFPVTIPPDPSDDSYQVQYYYGILSSYSVRPENQQAFAQIVARQAPGLTVVVVEMPVPDTYFDFFDYPSHDYNEFIKVLKTTTADHHVLFLETTRLRLIPDDGWMDYSHVNRKGATLFSEWLGQQLGKESVDGSLSRLQP